MTFTQRYGLHLRDKKILCAAPSFESLGAAQIFSMSTHRRKYYRKEVLSVLTNGRNQFNSADITLDNWKDFPFSTHTFQNVSELIPIEKIAGSSHTLLPCEINESILSESYAIGGQFQSGAEFLSESYTDALLVCKDGQIISEYYANEMTMFSPHLTFSVSKSITGIVAGKVFAKFGISTDTQICDVLDGTAGGAYADATIRHLLDMTVSLDFDESYASKEGVYARYRQAMLWMPRFGDSEFSDEDLAKFILSLPKGSDEHGLQFSYKSPNADLLGLVLEEISGLPLAQLISEELWMPLGCGPATITIDSKKMARTAGGLSCSIQDLAMVGELMRAGGIHSGAALLNPMWVVDTFTGGDKAAWSCGEFVDSFPDGSYRNQFYAIGDGVLCAIGIHGQWIYIDAAKEVVIAKFSCQPTADDDDLDRKSLDFFRAVASSL